MTPLLVGLTGGLASGKSTVARRLAERGCEVIDADEVVAELYRQGAAGSAAIAAIAGDSVLTAEGAVDHGALARRLFSDDAFRARIEAAIHPLVRSRFEERVAASDAAIVVLEATLLVEAGYGEMLDLVVTVEADRDLRLRRAVERGMPEAQASARLEAQGDGEARRWGADRELTNDGSLDELEQAVDELLADLQARAAELDDE